MKNQIKKYFTLVVFFFFGIVQLFAQDALTILKFETAEKAFNSGNYDKAIQYLDEVEEKTGVTSKTLYLRISAQDKLLEKGRTDLLESLKENVNTYLDKLKDQGLDDRYRFVYEVDKKISRYLTNKENKDEKNNSGEGDDLSPKNSAVRVYEDYFKAMMGGISPNSVKSIILNSTTEITGIGESSLMEIFTVKANEKNYMETKFNGQLSMKVVYNQGQGYSESYSGGESKKVPMDSSILKSYEEVREDPKFILGFWIPEPVKNGEAQVSTGQFNGNQVTVVKYNNYGNEKYTTEVYFSENSKLLLGQKTTLGNYTSSITVYEDYRKVSGILFSFSSVTEDETTVTIPGLKTGKKKSAKDKVNKSKYVTRYTSIKINDPVPDYLFE